MNKTTIFPEIDLDDDELLDEALDRPNGIATVSPGTAGNCRGCCFGVLKHVRPGNAGHIKK